MACVYISHPFSTDPEANAARIRWLVRELALRGHVPLAPQIYFPQFVDEAKERPLAMRLCLELLALADEVRVYGEPSEGMRLEILEAHRLGIPVITADPNDLW